MRLAIFGLKRMLLAMIVTPVILFLGTVALVDRRNDWCGRIDTVPGVDCPPLTERATSAAFAALAMGIVCALVFAAAARRPRGRWLGAVTADAYPYDVPRSWSVLTFLSWSSLLLGLLFASVFSAIVTQQPGDRPSSGSFRVFVAFVLVAVGAMVWTSWRWRRLAAMANRRAGVELFRVVRSSGSAGPPPSGVSDVAVNDRGSERWSGSRAEPWAPSARDQVDASTGWPGDSPTGGYPRSGSVYGDGPQHGTRAPADTQGGFYNDDQRDLRAPAEQPGGFYSDDPFGRDPDDVV